MTVEIPSIPCEAPESELHAALEEYGAVIVEDFLSAEVLAQLNGEMDSLIAAESDA